MGFFPLPPTPLPPAPPLKMTARHKKTRHMRGQVSHGHGRIGKHRKHPGGRGNAGGQHHHRINLDKIWTLVDEEKRDELIKNASESKAPVIDCVSKGVYKVLGKGVLPKAPVIVKAKFFSRTAEKKINDVGG